MTKGFSDMPRSTTQVGSCRFCQIEQDEAFLSGTNNESLVASVGALVPGWCLAVPHEHVYATAALSPKANSSFWQHAYKMRSVIEAQYGNTAMFEHGSAGTGRSASCGVNHAHVHIVPTSANLRNLVGAIRDDVGTFTWARCNEPGVGFADTDYIWVLDSTGAWITQAETLPSQVIRRALAVHLGIQVWDWKSDERITEVAETVRRLRRQPAKCNV